MTRRQIWRHKWELFKWSCLIRFWVLKAALGKKYRVWRYGPIQDTSSPIYMRAEAEGDCRIPPLPGMTA